MPTPFGCRDKCASPRCNRNEGRGCGNGEPVPSPGTAMKEAVP